MPYIAGHQKFPRHVRKSPECVTLPYLVFRNRAHIVTLCEASDTKGGMTIHEQLAKDHRMLGMVINAEITAPSLACFLRGSHDSGTFVGLLLHHQFETAQKPKPENNFWIFHGAVFRCAWGHCTAGEFLGDSGHLGAYKLT